MSKIFQENFFSVKKTFIFLLKYDQENFCVNQKGSVIAARNCTLLDGIELPLANV